MVRKIWGSGLNSHQSEFAHRRDPRGIHNLFTEVYEWYVTVTKSKKIIDSVVAFFSLEKEIKTTKSD